MITIQLTEDQAVLLLNLIRGEENDWALTLDNMDENGHIEGWDDTYGDVIKSTNRQHTEQVVDVYGEVRVQIASQLKHKNISY